MNGVTEIARDLVDARIELARVSELLPAIEKHLLIEGVDAHTAAVAGREANSLLVAIRQARMEAAARRVGA